MDDLFQPQICLYCLRLLAEHEIGKFSARVTGETKPPSWFESYDWKLRKYTPTQHTKVGIMHDVLSDQFHVMLTDSEFPISRAYSMIDGTPVCLNHCKENGK